MLNECHSRCQLRVDGGGLIEGTDQHLTADTFRKHVSVLVYSYINGHNCVFQTDNVSLQKISEREVSQIGW